MKHHKSVKMYGPTTQCNIKTHYQVLLQLSAMSLTYTCGRAKCQHDTMQHEQYLRSEILLCIITPSTYFVSPDIFICILSQQL